MYAGLLYPDQAVKPRQPQRAEKPVPLTTLLVSPHAGREYEDGQRQQGRDKLLFNRVPVSAPNFGNGQIAEYKGLAQQLTINILISIYVNDCCRRLQRVTMSFIGYKTVGVKRAFRRNRNVSAD
jgi:hypothetical protein